MHTTEKSFVAGAAILSGAALFGKILSALYRIPYQNITGNEGMYVYQQVYPLYSVLLILATAGFPIAISKLVSERLAVQDRNGAKRIFRISSVILLITGILLFLLLFLSAGQIAEWMGNEQLLTLPIRSVSFAFVVIPFLSVLRGYFQGFQDMVPTAVSQMVEQIVRVITILILSWYCMEIGWGFVYAGAGAILGATTGGIAAFLILFYYWQKRKKQISTFREVQRSDRKARESSWQIIRQILIISFPICLGSLVYPLVGLVDSFSVANLLESSGWSQTQAILMKGIFDRGQPLIQFAAFFATAISLSLVPAISEAIARNKVEEAKKQSQMALRLTWLLGLPASIGLAVIMIPINIMFFEDDAGSSALMILSFTPIFSTLIVTSTAILQGMGRVYLPAGYLLIGIVCKIVLNYLFIPIWDIRGAAMATVVSYALVSFLNVAALRIPVFAKKEYKYVFYAVGFLAFLTFLTMVGLKEVTLSIFPYRIAMAFTTLGSIIVGMVIYTASIFRLRLLTERDLEGVPKLKNKLLPLLRKWSWTRTEEGEI